MDTDIIDKLVSDWNTERPDLNVESMHVVGRLLKLGKILERTANDRIKDSGIHYTDLDVLATLKRSGPPYELSPKDLMASVLISSGAMTALLLRLSELELIYRVQSKEDARIKRAGLTPKAIELIDKVIEIRFAEADETLKVFTVEEKNDLSRLLKKLLLSLDQ